MPFLASLGQAKNEFSAAARLFVQEAVRAQSPPARARQFCPALRSRAGPFFDSLTPASIVTVVLIAQAAIPSSFSPLATILSASSGNGRCNCSAFGASAVSQRSTSASVVKMTGMALG